METLMERAMATTSKDKTTLTEKKQRASVTQNDPRWAALVARDKNIDGTFFYSVKTTGVYCRPSCSARLARPENISFHNSCAEAERAGFRPCKRCQPNTQALHEKNAALVANACRFIETSEDSPSLADLAERANLSTYHFHRMFKQVTGLTPKQYTNAHRNNRVRAQLTEGSSVTDAIIGAGYNSNSRFYEKSNAVLGMTPTRYREGGQKIDIHFAVGECSLGAILVAQSAQGICAILLDDDPQVLVRDLQDRFPHASLIGGDKNFEKLIATVIGFVEAPALGLELPLDVRGTAFQQRVWQALREIPAGQTASYTDIANRIGSPKAVRAVAGACAANAIAVAIPCHRVVRNDGGISGYRWGVERKRTLLEKESRNRETPQ
ncbi:MAG: O-6-methylguanine methyltransferase [Verrucomicrobiaceae bacterium]|nr:O-6-methylguanine methyltransferase [Verrucomicrobiaceae bacterium]